MDKTSSSWKRQILHAFGEVLEQRRKKLRTIFKLLGPCEILSHGQKAEEEGKKTIKNFFVRRR